MNNCFATLWTEVIEKRIHLNEILYFNSTSSNINNSLKENPMLHKQKEAFDAFYKSARHSGVIDNKTSLMIHLASSMAVGCIPCARYYLEQVDEARVTDDEISAIKTIVMAVSAGRVMMQFDEVLNSEAGGCLEDKGCDD